MHTSRDGRLPFQTSQPDSLNPNDLQVHIAQRRLLIHHDLEAFWVRCGLVIQVATHWIREFIRPLSSSLATASRSPNSFFNHKTILKKRNISEITLQRSLLASPVKQAAVGIGHNNFARPEEDATGLVRDGQLLTASHFPSISPRVGETTSSTLGEEKMRSFHDAIAHTGANKQQ